ncbi:AAA family ATPase [Candidatus Wolfebacteria bacterium]|nr:AAA family ATPase [Candidatus Wolfebacteria bacterium]
MFLKALELNGFKSFAQKTTLEFPAGITAIVGPNGSGKSNIIDAIRWLLGERDAKSLRGVRAEDLIWNGSPVRPRTSLAQTSLHFNNESGFFPVEASEVVLARRLGRDGTSEYFLNKSEARLKDIVDLLSRARLGTKGLIIISQGSSDLFVRVSPPERRIMIEEILGLREYELKKAEAERKLRNTFFNLEKVKGVTLEVLPRLRLLKRQTGKWEKRQVIAEDLKRLEDSYFGNKVRELDEAKEKLAPALLDIHAALVGKKKELGELEAALAAVRKEASTRQTWKDLERARTELTGKRSEVGRSIARLEAVIEIQKQAPRQIARRSGEDMEKILLEVRSRLEQVKEENDTGKLRGVIHEILSRISEALQGKNESHRNVADVELEAERKNLIEELKKLEDRIDEIHKAEGAIAAGLEQFNDRFRSAFEALEDKKEEIRRIDDEKNKIRFEEEKIDLIAKDLERQLLQAGRAFDEFRRVEPGGAEFSEQEFERKIFRLRAELASIGEIDPSVLREADEVGKHYEFLTVQSQDLHRAAGDLKNLIKELTKKVHDEFALSLKKINTEFNAFFRLMFDGGWAKLKIKNYESGIRNKEEEIMEGGEAAAKNQGRKEDEEREIRTGIEIELNLPKKKITNLDMLSGGEKSLVSIAALFALISVSPPPFLVLDEVDAPLDESNSLRFANLIKEFSKKTQFIVVTHNRSTMEVADALYGITMADDGCSRVLSVKLE